jgi:hypothetical protein
MQPYLTSIINFCGDPNPGGLQKIEYALLKDVDFASFEPIVAANYNWQQTILFERGGWLTMPVLPQKSRWEEKGSFGKHGPYYNQTVTGIMPNMRTEVAGELEKMARRKFVLRLTDKKGKKWLLGHPDMPFLFLVTGTSGEGTAGLNHYAIQFYSETSKKMTGYVPVF